MSACTFKYVFTAFCSYCSATSSMKQFARRVHARSHDGASETAVPGPNHRHYDLRNISCTATPLEPKQ
jgi:hypothetical protein